VSLDNILSIMGKYSVNKVPSDILVLIAQNVVALRKEEGWTQQELSEKSDVSYGSIKRFETSGQISLESLLKIVESLRRLSEFENILLPPKESQRIKDLFEIY
jgi:transcriptional regulator with XRE-family HTH domain